MQTTAAQLARDYLLSPELFIAGPLCLLWSATWLATCGALKRAIGVQTAYTRKLFHVVIFTSAVAAQHWGGLRLVCLFGGATSAVIFYAVWLGDGSPLYEAIARERDAPWRTYYVLVPYVATLVGGLASNVLFGDYALVGYLVVGMGDAVGEPVGARFGRHRYLCPALWGTRTTRSLEGSCAVFLASALATAAAAAALGKPVNVSLAAPSLALGAVSALIEAMSPHGWDNASLQVGATLLASMTL